MVWCRDLSYNPVGLVIFLICQRQSSAVYQVLEFERLLIPRVADKVGRKASVGLGCACTVQAAREHMRTL